MQGDLNDIKTLFDDILVNFHFITRYYFIHQRSSQDKMERAKMERMLRYYIPSFR